MFLLGVDFVFKGETTYLARRQISCHAQDDLNSFLLPLAWDCRCFSIVDVDKKKKLIRFDLELRLGGFFIAFHPECLSNTHFRIFLIAHSFPEAFSLSSSTTLWNSKESLTKRAFPFLLNLFVFPLRPQVLVIRRENINFIVVIAAERATMSERQESRN